ncbi:MAG: sugar phosphate isomerase/epimerase [Actinobacteria bacterium]|nr:sugar phosphate isomerase/epimerase [Actinomycetota bacterium]
METKSDIKFSTVLATFGNQADRFCQSGYKSSKSLEEMFILAKKVKDLSGLELVGTWNINEENVDLITKYKHEYNFEITCIVIDLFTQAKWQKGSFANKDNNIRKQAIEEVKKYMDIAKILDCPLIDVWLGQDGYDYSFQTDYIKSWNMIIEGLGECAGYRDDIKVGLEYKIKEPRTHCFISTIGKTLLLIEKVNKKNLGVLADVGHALYSYENMAETVSLCKLFGNKLFHLHLNDNYRLWDDDMMVGSVHIVEYLELMYWLKAINYNGWYSIDIYPFREDAIGAVNETIKWLKEMQNAVSTVDKKEIEEVINSEDSIKSSALVRKMLFK